MCNTSLVWFWRFSYIPAHLSSKHLYLLISRHFLPHPSYETNHNRSDRWLLKWQFTNASYLLYFKFTPFCIWENVLQYLNLLQCVHFARNLRGESFISVHRFWGFKLPWHRGCDGTQKLKLQYRRSTENDLGSQVPSPSSFYPSGLQDY